MLPGAKRWGWRILGVAGVVFGAWAVAGLERFDPSAEIAVLDGPWPGAPVRLSAGWAWAPRGLLRLERYPRFGVELVLPPVEEASVGGPDGARYGLRGRAVVRVREEGWRSLHAAAAGGGLRGALAAAVRAAEIRVPLAWRKGGPVPPPVARDVASALSAALERRGLELVNLELSGFAPWLADGAPLLPQRVLVIGLDGADWEILDSLIAQGRLPHLARLAREGARGKLLSLSPMLSPVIWTSVATGVQPIRHGILDFLVSDPSHPLGLPVTTAHRRVPALWNMLSQAGARVGVVGWWATWPAERVEGYLVSDRVAYQLFGIRDDARSAEGKTWPPELYEKLREKIVAPESVSWDEVAGYLNGQVPGPEVFSPEARERLEQFRTLLASGRTYLEIALALRERYDPQFEAVYFEGTDTVGHLFMPFRAPRMPHVPAEEFETFRDVVDRYYETVDGYVGRLLQGREGWTVVVLSDHGFASGADRPRRTDPRIGHGAAADWHRKFGILIVAGPLARGGQISEASVYDIAPTILALFGQPVPLSWPGRVLAEALAPSFLAAHPVRLRDDTGSATWSAQSDFADPEAAAVRQKLEALGYVGPSGEGLDRVSAFNNTGVALLAEGRLAEAERAFREGLSERPEAAPLLANLGIVLRLQGKRDEAEEILERAAAHASTRRVAYAQLAELELERGDLAAAQARLEALLAWEPDAPEAHTKLGLVLEGKGDPDRARRAYRRAAELDPHNAVARNNLGNLAKREGHWAEAEHWYREALEADPYFMGAYNNLALLYQERGEAQRAKALYLEALERAPGHPVVLNNLASLHYAAGELEEARRLWWQCVATDPSYVSPLNNLAGLAIREGDLQQAERLLHEALAREPGYGDARINLSLVHSQRGAWDEARSELERAMADPRARTEAEIQLGLLELAQGRMQAAADHLERAARAPLGPGRLREVWTWLAQAYEALGRDEEAAHLRERLANTGAPP